MSALVELPKATKSPCCSVASPVCASPSVTFTLFSALFFAAVHLQSCLSTGSGLSSPHSSLSSGPCGYFRRFTGPVCRIGPHFRCVFCDVPVLSVVPAGDAYSVSRLTAHKNKTRAHHLAPSFQSSSVCTVAECRLKCMPCITRNLQPLETCMFIHLRHSGHSASRDESRYSDFESRPRKVSPWAKCVSLQNERATGLMHCFPRCHVLTNSQRNSNPNLCGHSPFAAFPSLDPGGRSTRRRNSPAYSPDRAAIFYPFLSACGRDRPVGCLRYSASALRGSRSSTSNPKQAVARQGNHGSGKKGTSTFTASGKIVSALPGGYFMVELSAVTSPRIHSSTSPSVAHSPPAVVTPPALVGKQMLCSLGGKLRLNRIRVQLFDMVDVEFCPLDPTRGRIIYRRKPTSSDTPSSQPS
ncbi:hypothetical protein TGME49_217620 [Toxoplasma gondii ME49]|uniref:Translation initiation factor n=7 Tax=Toxoplasma gondii TaxID=5811 RepID=B6KU06_TOXGV|nr:hypothetical protein TGME49_217620 [Toxoplasma gondii ME49]ESS34099.1 putative translation initiation factor [Toxoplasma gondii VEG]KFG37809.1 putative translation initiation factor [Toxoplasma gondii p89]KFG47299.1 putative translation initiation factor [Toxoplasma gondii GAB2-2007-GAL-DOM2]KFG50612.1 putative translation initiation factor [Toxoplasma gondii FOU]KFH05294.1 putative translation initiation factor [Toxoplasma gondii VAND]PUA88646.1 putative translation initiation factor [Tox|eukprot:XP_002371329.1 hypothetical protein TGME49_217620 [Toxoplasma gondii ME49]